MRRILLILSVSLLFVSCSRLKKISLFSKKNKTDVTEKTAKTHHTKKSSSFAAVYKSKDVEFKYQMAEQFYAKKRYNNAQELFESLIPSLKGDARYEDMYYKIGYCYYFEKDYANAENIFKTFTEYFPTSSKSEECEYMRAYCFYKQSPKVELDQTATNKAMNLMQAFINTHPTSPRSKDASDIMDKCREKLELKEYKSAELYYNLGYYKASAIAFGTVSENFPDSKKADEYKLEVIKAYFKYADASIEDKQPERYQKVLSECSDFLERFTDSKLINEVKQYKTQTTNILNKFKNEQAKKTSQQ
jgi:outer membrane protein assembly factor BamD